ncbi:MAG: SpoIIIAH-like family protein [Turicibacter sp.]|nr:SpoIIIAH-like family protein [Turicibacter sp.]
MNKNSYVTAALFVVFVLLSVFYCTIGDTEEKAASVGTSAMLPDVKVEITSTDEQAVSELVSTEETAELEGSSSTVSALQVQRAEAKKAETQLVSELTAIIASKDYDAEAKSEAKDNLEQINKDAQHQSMLESMIKAKGYSDVLVRVNEGTVQVFLELSDSQEEPTLEQQNEIIMMAKTEFTTNPDVQVSFTAIN